MAIKKRSGNAKKKSPKDPRDFDCAGKNVIDFLRGWYAQNMSFLVVASLSEETKQPAGVLSQMLKKDGDFVCVVDLQNGMCIKDATHCLEEAYFPRKKTSAMVHGLICAHCHESGF